MTASNKTVSVPADSTNSTPAVSASLLVTTSLLSTSLPTVNGAETNATAARTSASESSAVTQSVVVNNSSIANVLDADNSTLTTPTVMLNDTDSVTLLPTTVAATTG